MSLKYLAWAMDTDGPRLATRLVLFVLCEAANDHQFEEDGPVWAAVCWPSVDRIGARAFISERAVYKALAELDELELVRTVPTDIDFRWWGKPITTTVRQVRGGADFAPLPNDDPAGNDTSPPAQNDTQTVSSKGREADASQSSLSKLYGEPVTPGSAAAPWLVLELARLMRANDEKVRLPVGLREPVNTWRDLTALGRPTPLEAQSLLEEGGWHESLKQWLNAARLLVDADERPAREVAKVLRWTQQDSFEMANVQSMTKLRQRYSNLRAKAFAEQPAADADRRRHDQGSQLDAMTRQREQPDRQKDDDARQ